MSKAAWVATTNSGWPKMKVQRNGPKMGERTLRWSAFFGWSWWVFFWMPWKVAMLMERRMRGKRKVWNSKAVVKHPVGLAILLDVTGKIFVGHTMAHNLRGVKWIDSKKNLPIRTVRPRNVCTKPCRMRCFPNSSRKVGLKQVAAKALGQKLDQTQLLSGEAQKCVV